MPFLTVLRLLGPALAAVAVHGAAVVWLTWPLATFATTHLPGWYYRVHQDALLLGWALAHESRALVGDWASFPHAPAFHPTPWALFYGEAGFGALPLFAPVFLGTGNATLAVNATFLGGITLTATSLHLVIRRLTGSWLAGLVGAWVFLTTPWVLWSWMPIAPNYAVLVYLPVILLLTAEGVTTTPRLLALAALVTLQGLSSAYLAAAAALVPGVLALARLARPATRREGLRILAALLLAAAALAPAYAGYAIVRRANPDIAQQSAYWMIRYGRMEIPKDLFRRDLSTGFSLAAVVLVAAGVCFRRLGAPDERLGRAWRHGLLWVAVGFVCSLTPYVTWRGQAVALPHAWIAGWIPVYDVLREPHRLGVVALVGLAVLTGASFVTLVQLLGRRVRPAVALALATLVGGALYLDYARGFEIPGLHAFEPLPLRYPSVRTPRPTPALAQALAARPGPLLELPVGPKTYPHTEAMYRSIEHRRPVVNGYNGYWPDTFPARMRLACRLPQPQALAKLRRLTGLATILVHPRALDRMPPGRGTYGCQLGMPRSAEWRAAAAAGRPDLRLLGDVGGSLLFAVGP